MQYVRTSLTMERAFQSIKNEIYNNKLFINNPYIPFDKIIEEYCNYYIKNINDLMGSIYQGFVDTNLEFYLNENLNNNTHRTSNIRLDRVNSDLNNLIKENFPSTSFLSAERTGIVTFKPDLNIAQNQLMRYLPEVKTGNKISVYEINQLMKKSGYPLPIHDNIIFANIIEKMDKGTEPSPIFKKQPAIFAMMEEIAGGRFGHNESGAIHFIPNGTPQLKLSIHESSSAVRALAFLFYYVKYTAQAGQLLIIDEPELNLHPHNQRLMARLMVRLVNAGVRILVSTHSDYIVREINSLIMFHHNPSKSQKIMDKYGYLTTDLLDKSAVSLYYTKEKGEYQTKEGINKKGLVLVKADINELGIEAPSFNQDAEELDKIQEEIYAESFLVDE